MAWKKSLNCGLRGYSGREKKVGNKDKPKLGLSENIAWSLVRSGGPAAG